MTRTPSRRRRLVFGLALGILVLVVVAGILVWQSSTRPASAEDAAQGFLRALESGDPSAVEATGTDTSAASLAAFAGATALIDSATVDEVDERSAGATAHVSFRLDGERHRAVLALSRTDGAWRIETSALGRVDVSSTVQTPVSIGDSTFSPGETIALLPAEYTVTAAPAALVDGTAPVVVLPDETAAVELTVSLRAAATEAVQAELDAHLEDCASEGGARPVGCGIRIPWGTEFRDVDDATYRIEAMPTITADFPRFTADAGVLVATVSGTGQDGAPRTTTYRTEAWSVRGVFSFTQKGVAVTVW